MVWNPLTECEDIFLSEDDPTLRSQVERARRLLDGTERFVFEVDVGMLPKSAIREAVAKIRERFLSEGVRFKGPIEGKGVRIEWNLKKDSMTITELPGKPVKRQVRRMEIYTGYFTRIKGGSGFLIQNLGVDAKLSKSMTYDSAVKAMRRAILKAAKSAEEYLDFDKYGGLKAILREKTVSHLKVTPKGYKPLEVRGKNFNLKSEWTTFRAYDPGSDMQAHVPSYTYYEAKSPTAARKLYKILQKNPRALSRIMFNDLDGWLKKKKIHYSIHFSQWH